MCGLARVYGTGRFMVPAKCAYPANKIVVVTLVPCFSPPTSTAEVTLYIVLVFSVNVVFREA